MPTQDLSVVAGRLHPVTAQGRGTREALIRAALEQFAEHGVLGARVEGITSDAGVAYGTFYKYFHSKLDLVRAILRDVYTDITRCRLSYVRAKPRPLAERAYPDILGTLRAFYQHRVALRVLDVALGTDADLAEYVRALQQEAMEAGTEVIGELSRDTLGMDPGLSSLAINAAIDESARRWIRSDELTGDPAIDDVRLRELARTLTAMSVAAIDPDEVTKAIAVADGHRHKVYSFEPC